MAPNEQEGKSGDLNKYLIISLVSTAILCIVFAGVNYLVMENLLTQKINNIQVNLLLFLNCLYKNIGMIKNIEANKE